MTTIGISGAHGSFSEQAAQEYIRTNNINNYQLEYLISAENVLQNLNQGKINLGIFPIENSNGGIVVEAVHAMSRHTFNIKNIFEIPIIHCLLVIPGTKKEAIAKIASHPQAIKQCKMYLKRVWPKAELEERDDTAHAASDLKNGVLPASTAVIAPEPCAKLYNLKILEKDIQDLKFNYTSFLAVQK